MERAELGALVRATGCAVERDGDFFLRDPKGVAAELPARGGAMGGGERGWLMIPSGGTSGALKFARHDERTLGAAVEGFCAHFELGRVNAVDVLPAHHVSGLMARVRCAATGGTHVAWEWKKLEAGGTPALRAGEDWVISLVPTQLQRLLASQWAVVWLRGFRVIFVGGGPVWTELADAAARAELRVSLSYGMTETAAMVTALRPEEFLNGERSSGRALPHARLTVADAGTVRIEGESVFRGYFPEWRDGRVFETEDLARVDAEGRWQILGRRDALIITGGEKVNPAEVEAVLWATGGFADVAVVGVADAEWGERIVACYPAGGGAPDMARVGAGLAALAVHARPKRYIAVADWPRNAQGKLNRALLREMARQVG
jgi:O-succinylbenzoic acid--CoA ligase